jgi:hypothetical protein
MNWRSVLNDVDVRITLARASPPSAAPRPFDVAGMEAVKAAGPSNAGTVPTVVNWRTSGDRSGGFFRRISCTAAAKASA